MSQPSSALTIVGDAPAFRDEIRAAAQSAGVEISAELTAMDAMAAAAAGEGPRGRVVLGMAGTDEAFTAARLLTQGGGVRLALVIDDPGPVRAGIASFCGAGAVWGPGEANSELPATLARWSDSEGARPKIDELAAVLPEQLLRELGQGLNGVSSGGACQGTEAHDPRPTRLIEALADPETSLFNYDFLTYKLDEEFKRSRRFGQPLSCVKLTFDGECSEAVLRQLGSVFLQAARDTDILGRFDRSSFLFLLPGTSPDGAWAMADRIVESVANLGLVDVVGDALDLSIGLVSCPHPGVERAEDLYRLAVEACQEAARSNERVVALPS